MPAQNTGFESLNPTHIRIKMPLVRKATKIHLIKSSSLEIFQSTVSGFCHIQNQVCSAGFCIQIATLRRVFVSCKFC